MKRRDATRFLTLALLSSGFAVSVAMFAGTTQANAAVFSYVIGNASCQSQLSTCPLNQNVDVASTSDVRVKFHNSSCRGLSLEIFSLMNGSSGSQTFLGETSFTLANKKSFYILTWSHPFDSYPGRIVASGQNSGCPTNNVLTMWSGDLNRAATASLSTLATYPPRTGSTDLGALSVDAYCMSTANTHAKLAKGSISGPQFAFNNWSCGNAVIADMSVVCRWQYAGRAPFITAVNPDPNSAYGWMCQGSATSMTPGSMSNVAPIAAALGTPGQIFHSLKANLFNALLTVGAMLLITFPANLFNSTFSANYDSILQMIANARRRLRRVVGLKVSNASPSGASNPETAQNSETPGRASRSRFYMVLLVGTIFGGLLNPSFGMNRATIIGLVATFGAFALGTVMSWFITKFFRSRHHYSLATYRKALPLGLLIAVMCVVISRVTNFQPGYLYGVVVSVAFVGNLEERHNAQLTVLTVLSTLLVGILAWFLWIPVNHLAIEHGANVIIVLLDDVLASIFIGSLVGTVIGLMPLEFLPGGTLAKWRKDVWAFVFFIATFLLIEVELHPASGPTHPGGAPIVTIVVLFVGFGGLSLAMQRFFKHRKTTATAKDSESPSDPVEPKVPKA